MSENQNPGIFRLYLKQHSIAILYALFCAGVFLTVFGLFQFPMAAVGYALILCAVPGVLLLILGFVRVRKRHKIMLILQRSVDALPELPSPETAAEADYAALLRQHDKICKNREEQLTARLREQAEYYALWAHQVKTPIAAMNLTLQGEDSPVNRRLSLNLNRISQYVDMALAIQRLDADGNDLVIKECGLDEIVQGAVRRFAGEFIDRKLQLHYEPLREKALTDEKWLSFVLEQLLSNALKYTKTGGVTIRMAAPQILCLQDTGMGIAPEDVPRVFEKGYTGYNGRQDQGASGIGLYLCRRVCDMLEHKIWIESNLDAGTAVFIDLNRKKVEIE